MADGRLLFQALVWVIIEMQQYINISPYRDTLGSDTHLGHIDISNIVTYRCINIKTVYVQYFMTDAVVVYCGCQFYSSATTHLVCIESYHLEKSSVHL